MKKIGFQNHRSGRLYPHLLPILVWLGALAGVVGLLHHRSQRFEVVGFARSQVRQIAATCTGRLKSVPVQLFENVSQGQVVAVIDTVLDNEHLQAELATISAEIDRLMAELVPTQDRLVAEATNLTSNRIADNRRFSADVEAARLRILELKTLLATDRIALEDLGMEVKIAQELVGQDAIAPYELQKVEVQYNALAKKIEENERLLEQATQDLKQAQERQNEFAQHQLQHPSVDGALDVIHKSITVQERRIEELLARREALELSSPFDGVVSQILAQPGEAVLAGAPILTIAEITPREVVAYAGEDQANQIRAGAQVELIKNTEPAQVAWSQVSYIGPVIEQMPIRLWRNPNIPQWGRPMLITIPPDLKLISGELVGVRRLPAD